MPNPGRVWTLDSDHLGHGDPWGARQANGARGKEAHNRLNIRPRFRNGTRAAYPPAGGCGESCDPSEGAARVTVLVAHESRRRNSLLTTHNPPSLLPGVTGDCHAGWLGLSLGS